ncbi:MAG: Outer rane efflux protein [Pedosphaera sp.]|nr:Outer rane efflux protein [Pedosphaera sp.]
MKPHAISYSGVMLLLGGAILLPMIASQAQNASQITNTSRTAQPGTYAIDLPTVLKLANAQNLDVQIAQQQSAEARARYETAVMQFLPWVSPGIGYQRHDNLAQDTPGNILDVHKQNYTPGATFSARIDAGEALYTSLAARQNVQASGHAVEAQRQNSVLAAALGYFDLLQAGASVRVAEEASRISRNYEGQIKNAVDAGLAYKGDQLRVQVQTGQTELVLRQSRERQRVVAARLATILYLDPTVELVANEQELVPLSLISSNAALGSLVEAALANRPEIHQSRALVQAANSFKQGAVLGPLIPSLGGQAYLGGLGGGIDHMPGRFGESEDYTATLSWRIGPGGLFDFGHIHQSQAQLEIARLSDEKLRDEILRQVVESLTRFRSLSDQLATARETLAAAAEAQKLAEQRKEFGVGVVLEAIQTQLDLTRAQNDFLNTVAEYDKAQYSLETATGGLLNQTEHPRKSPLESIHR